ncbi:MAG: endonuclease/exonuclease/phosphatase family protein [Lentimicrobiaceae bacterium]|nr:endonuclease/exonuclease/phosphatase family protein [Lentimicrobiaceae bacterium]
MTSISVFVVYLMSLSAGHVNPSRCYLFAFAGLGFPVMFALQFINTLLNLKRRKWFWVLFFFLLLGIPTMLRHYALPLKSGKKHGKYSMISYNVRGLNIPGNVDQSEDSDLILSALPANLPDLLFFQEFEFKKIRSNSSTLHQYLYRFPRPHSNSQIIFSTFPLHSGGKLSFNGEVFAVYADVDFPGQTIKVINVHLRSLMLTTERELLQPSIGKTVHRSNIRKIIRTFRKLRNAFKQRSHEVEALRALIDESPYPVLLAGDFNDTPASYAFHQINSILNDATFLRGWGWRKTYLESTFPLKIDHIFVSSHIHTRHYDQIFSAYSDHNPVGISFDLSD